MFCDRRSLLLVGVLLAACSDHAVTTSAVVSTGDSIGGTNGRPTGAVVLVVLQLQSQTLFVGDSVSVTAILENAQGQVLAPRPVTWSVSDSSRIGIIASVGNWAVLRALRSGSATIEGTVEGKRGASTITVR